MAEPVILCLSRSGEATAHRVAGALGAKVHGREGRVDKADAFFPNALDHARDLFAAGVPVVGVCAAGILIRAVAPLLNDKRAEPPVVAVADDGSSVVPLLGGHRGANRIARKIATALDIPASITTAGDIALGISLDEPPAGWRIEREGAAKDLMAAVLAGDSPTIAGGGAWADHLESKLGGKRLPGSGINFLVGGRARDDDLTVLYAGGKNGVEHRIDYYAQRYTIGVGCARNCSAKELSDLVVKARQMCHIQPPMIAGIFSLDLKADEHAVLSLASDYRWPFRVFDAATLEAESPRLANPSEVVFAEVGCHGVAEGAALAAAGPDAELVVPKLKTANATVAIARAPAPITELRGRKRGRVSLVGIGPGQAAWRTPEASRMVAEAEELIGYGLYIDLLGPLAAGKPRHDYPLGGEEARCRFALERAGEGRDVALICSGDAGIYAMGALVFELLDKGGLSDAASRVEVVSAPGVSALQAAAARAGAPLGHDFCAISLSDLLTPREDILRRITAAAEGNFVIAFYNPVSKTRRTLLAEAREILLAHRPADTPVLLASSLGRPEEKLVYRDLAALEVDEVDMLTVVLIGSSQSRVTAAGRMYTPRGYAKKMETPT